VRGFFGSALKNPTGFICMVAIAVSPSEPRPF
jgi:hypothetical protein